MKISLWLVFTTLVIVLAGFTSIKHDNTACKKPNILITKVGENNFVNDAYIFKTLYNKGYHFDTSLKEVDINNVESVIMQLPEIENVNVYKTLDGTIEIQLTERHPLFRVINKSGQQFYIDNKGKTMPLSQHYVAHTHIATGNISYSYKKDKQSIENNQVINDIKNITQHIVQDTFLNSQIVQIEVNKDQDIVLIPRVGEQKILFGNGTMIEDKFNRLKTFYKKGIQPHELNKYTTLNLKYKQQIICSKR